MNTNMNAILLCNRKSSRQKFKTVTILVSVFYIMLFSSSIITLFKYFKISITFVVILQNKDITLKKTGYIYDSTINMFSLLFDLSARHFLNKR